MLDISGGYVALQNLYGEYSACLDAGDFERWPDFFLDECEYRIQARENYDRKLPLSILWLESRGMLKDRVYGIRETLYHDPYYQRHIVSAPRVIGVEGGEIRSEANYLVLRTKRDEFSEVFNAGRYIDVVRETPEGLRFKSRSCIFDSEVVKNSIIYPI
ncbi:aromatic-ring-hydroxylating dioxygenase subunit beta [Pseudorhodoplanes sp.]|jgi:salicylate 5-hydroxylase small subunit|uniref:aromatic-ring-hydroxylating dioxygenase subunit beta n=1 Tax=Pseudorhodoplanes sp. TaxID=1934341 RepID=UPI002C036815|nr:aromatic-ring-hydroxylating dioxygenase subunit beta [Pseudorhodoplanes sp.]HWV39996.1 aromatic-ring-hydroxylating dioxygenase subunit beta [Pseudorhodoplanes sp.]